MGWVNLNTIYATKSDLNTGLAARVPTSRTINGKALSSDVTLGAGDVKLSDGTTLQGAWDSISQVKTLYNNADGSYMNGGQTATLSESVSKQKHGIVLCWCEYDKTNKKPLSSGFNYYFVPKTHVTYYSGIGIGMFLTNGSFFDRIGAKYVYVNDETIVGHDRNSSSGTKNGITYDNTYYVLRFVFGV